MDFLKHFDGISEDLWTYLEKADKPIAIYGMGDGADKILDRLQEHGICVAGIFASDGFVRRKVFRGMTLESYSEIKERLSSFIVLLSFATCLDDVIENIKRIASEQELYAPDVPVYGEGTFDMSYFHKKSKSLERVYNLLCDDISRKAFINSIKFRLTGKIEYLFDCETDVAESYINLLKPHVGCIYVDVGAYNGDTVREFLKFSGKNIKVTTFEPDQRTYKKLTAFSGTLAETDITCYNAAAWCEDTELTFYSRSGRNSSKEKNNHTNKESVIKAMRVDSVVDNADFIKVDAEGSELQVIEGMKKLIATSLPSMNIAAYHRTEDYLTIPEKVFEITDKYNLYFRHFKYIPCWDTNFYFIRNK